MKVSTVFSSSTFKLLDSRICNIVVGCKEYSDCTLESDLAAILKNFVKLLDRYWVKAECKICSFAKIFISIRSVSDKWDRFAKFFIPTSWFVL